MSTNDDVEDCSSVTGIVCEFQQHASQYFRQAHHKLNTQCAELIKNVQDILTAKDADVPSPVVNRIIDQMSDDDVVRRKFREFCKSSAITMKWHLHSPDGLC